MPETEVTQRKTAKESERCEVLVEGLLKKTILREGTGPNPPADGTHTMVMHYTGKLTDGTVFDSSVSRGTPFEFTLGAREGKPGQQLYYLLPAWLRWQCPYAY